MKHITQIFRLIVGIIFIISGFVKLVDPIGFSYKLEEYFGPGVFNIPFLESLALPMSIFFVILEFMLGVFLLLGIWKKITIYTLLGLIIFFAFLTFYSAYFNKVTDCGCFGDALKFDPWISFWKDMVLLIMILFIFKGMQYIHLIFSSKISFVIAFISLLIMGDIAYFGIAHQPIIDFRPYAVGNNVVDEMRTANELGYEPTKYETVYTLKHKETGEIQKMNDSVYIASNIWKEANWEIDNDLTIQKKIFQGYEPAIDNFDLDCEKGDRSKDLLSFDKVIVFTIPFTDRITDKQKEKIIKYIEEIKSNEDLKYSIIAGSREYLEELNSKICVMDPTTIKTINRSNIGVMILKNATIVYKENFNDIAKLEKLNDL